MFDDTFWFGTPLFTTQPKNTRSNNANSGTEWPVVNRKHPNTEQNEGKTCIKIMVVLKQFNNDKPIGVRVKNLTTGRRVAETYNQTTKLGFCKELICQSNSEHLVHSPNQLIDLVFTISSITTLNIVVSLLFEATGWGTKLKWPQKVVCFLEMRSHGHDLVNQILNTDNSILAKSLI